MKSTMKACMFLSMLMLALGFSACGSSPATYTISGTVTNLVAVGGVKLQNGAATLTVTANGSFAFRSGLRRGSTYNVTISAQPSSPAQTCGVTHGSGTVTGDVTDVAVDCGHNEWTWMSGANVGNQPGTYGTKGTPAPDNVPGARDNAVSWTDTAGNFWLFGGWGLNDLWKYSAGEWTWMRGANECCPGGIYGTLGTPDPGNVPGAHFQSDGWTDAAGNLWLFGGYGIDSATAFGDLNDLWKYSAGEWTWMGGANVVHQAGIYGTQGTAAPGNVPGARNSPVAWTDAAGNLWLFGGWGLGSSGTDSYLNDLWKYSAGEWTWMGGANVVGQAGTYGTQGTPAPGNVPGARWAAVTWIDAAGNLWLFGGLGLDSAGTFGGLNDLWKYEP